MIRNYLLSLWRYVSRNKGFTIINVAGLAIGMVACILIAQYVLHELSYDSFLSTKDRIFRIQLDRYDKGVIATRWASGAAGIGPDLKANFPEVEKMVRMTGGTATLSAGDVFFKEDHVYFTSEDFFRVFPVRLVEGIDSLVLKEPGKIVLSQSMARKYFGEEDPIGKTMKSNGLRVYEVSGVFEDLPENSHMKIDGMSSFASFQKIVNDPITTWDWDGFYTYVLLRGGADPKAFEAKLPAFVKKHLGDGTTNGNSMVFHLQAINDIHLDSDFIGEFKTNGNRQSVYFLATVAILIMFIAWINYVNLSTAKSIERAREVGVRKVMGGYRGQLIQQFLTESLLLNVLAVTSAIVLSWLLTPWFSGLTGRNLGHTLFYQPIFWAILLVIIVLGSIIAGLYPAFVLSAFRPVEVLKGKFKNSDRGVWLRKGMVMAQFVASITLMVGTFVVYEQISYMRNQELGVDIDQTVVLDSPNVRDSTYEEKFAVFRQMVMQGSEVVSVTGSSAVPGGSPDWNAGGIRTISQREEDANQYRVIAMDGSFIKGFGLEVVAGRGFIDGTPNERKNVMLNESASKLMGFKKPEDAVDVLMNFWGDTFRIVGVLKNYHQESLKKSFDQLVFRYSPAPNGFYSIKFNTGDDVRASMARFEKVWNEVFPGNPFIYNFLDDHYNQQYQADKQFGDVFGIFSGLAIFIACLGLFGLSSLTTLQRTKEIGIRKVLGASIFSILRLISRDLLALIGLAIIISVPLTVWIMGNWLTQFAYPITLAWWIFAIPSATVVMIALLTVSTHTIRAAMTDPVRSLRYE